MTKKYLDYNKFNESKNKIEFINHYLKKGYYINWRHIFSKYDFTKDTSFVDAFVNNIGWKFVLYYQSCFTEHFLISRFNKFTTEEKIECLKWQFLPESFNDEYVMNDNEINEYVWFNQILSLKFVTKYIKKINIELACRNINFNNECMEYIVNYYNVHLNWNTIYNYWFNDSKKEAVQLKNNYNIYHIEYNRVKQ